MKIFKNITKLCLISSVLLSTACANDSFYYQPEGQLLFKMKGFYADVDSTPEFDASITPTGNPKDIISSVYGGEAGVNYFLNAHFAVELTTGVAVMNVSKSEINKVSAAIGTGSGAMDGKDIMMVPFGAMIQYHIAPYGAIRPYLGAGYYGAVINIRSDDISTSNSHGAALQVGVDFVAKDDTFITLEAKQYFMDTTLTFEKPFLDPALESINKVKSKLKLNPLIISLGFGWRF